MRILMIHGVNTNEDAVPNPYVAWVDALTTGLRSAGYKGRISASPTTNGARYNDIFDKYSDNILLYGVALAELLKSAAWHSLVGPSDLEEFALKDQLAAAPNQPSGSFLSNIRWTGGMVAQWVVESDLRRACRNRLFDLIKKVKPEVILAHSLGTLLSYDLFVNDPRGRTLFADGTVVTFGSQIANPFVRDRMWGGQIEMINVKMWYNLYNPHDPVFVSPIDVAASNFHQFVMHPPFGGLFDISAHDASKGDGHAGYLDNSTTNATLWPALAAGSMAKLIARNIRILKRVPPKAPH